MDKILGAVTAFFGGASVGAFLLATLAASGGGRSFDLFLVGMGLLAVWLLSHRLKKLAE